MGGAADEADTADTADTTKAMEICNGMGKFRTRSGSNVEKATAVVCFCWRLMLRVNGIVQRSIRTKCFLPADAFVNLEVGASSEQTHVESVAAVGLLDLF